jgi:hypothetical protein
VICHFRKGANWKKSLDQPESLVSFVSPTPSMATLSAFPSALLCYFSLFAKLINSFFLLIWFFFPLISRIILSYTLLPIYFKHVPSCSTLRDFDRHAASAVFSIPFTSAVMRVVGLVPGNRGWGVVCVCVFSIWRLIVSSGLVELIDYISAAIYSFSTGFKIWPLIIRSLMN